jgi:hypothetical protein
MIDSEIGRTPTSASTNRIKFRSGRLRVDLPGECFQTSFFSFTSAAESFAMGLSDVLHRKFAYRYLSYLQEIARSSEPAKPSSIHGLPACRLICNELERLFRAHFFQPNGAVAG